MNEQNQNFNDELYETPQASRWFAMLVVVIAIGGVVYYSGLWDTIQSVNNIQNNENLSDLSSTTTNSTSTNSTSTIKEESKKEEVKIIPTETQKTDNQQKNTTSSTSLEKGDLKVVISAGVELGNIITSSNRNNIEITKVALYNQYKKDWLSLYEGNRPLNLIDLQNKKSQNQLSNYPVLGMIYDKVLIEYNNLVDINGVIVAQPKSVELNSFEVKSSTSNTLNIKFNLDNINDPKPFIVN